MARDSAGGARSDETHDDVQVELTDTPAGAEPGALTAARPGGRVARVADGALESQVAGLGGLDEGVLLRAPAGTAYGRWALVPAVTGAWDGSLLVAHVRLAGTVGGRGGSGEPVTASVDGLTARIGLPGGDRLLDWSDTEPAVSRA